MSLSRNFRSRTPVLNIYIFQCLSLTTLQFTFQSIVQYISPITILIFNRTIAENYTNISNKKSFFGYQDVIKYTVGRDQIYHKVNQSLCQCCRISLETYFLYMDVDWCGFFLKRKIIFYPRAKSYSVFKFCN